MEPSRLRPRVVLWWGIGLTVGGVLLTIVVPSFAYGLAVQREASTPVDQGLLQIVQLATQLIAQVVPLLGVVLIGASVAMAYVAKVLGGPTPVTASEFSGEDR